MAEQFSKYERARILGARGLQIAMDAPLLLKIEKEELENLNYDPLKLAEKELDSGVLPISVKRPMPEKKIEKIEKIKVDEVVLGDISDEKKIEEEKHEEKEILDEGEIMELAKAEDEDEAFDEGSSGEEA